MKIRFIYGRAGSGKTRFCLDEIKKAFSGRESDGGNHSQSRVPLILLVPEQFTFQAEKVLANVLGIGGIIGIEVLSFKRMAFRIFNEAGGIAYPRLHPAGRSMVLYGILKKVKADLKNFAGSSEKRGFIGRLASLITEFKRYNITPNNLKEFASKIAGNEVSSMAGNEVSSTSGNKVSKIADNEDGKLAGKLYELASVYELYNSTVNGTYRDPNDDLSAAAVKLEHIGIYNGALVWIDGFDGFTPQEYRLIAALMKKSGMISVSLCTDSLRTGGLEGIAGNGRDIFAPVRATYRKLAVLAEQEGAGRGPDVHIIVQDNATGVKAKQADDFIAASISGQPAVFNAVRSRFSASNELHILEKNYDAYPYDVFKEKTKDIGIFTAANMFSETEAAAGEILRLCRDCGMRFRDVAVTAREPEAYRRLVEVIFSEYGIPYFIDAKRDVADHPVIRMVLAMTDVITEDWSYSAVFRYLKTGLAGIGDSDSDMLENYVLACGIRGGSRWLSEKEWDMRPGIMPEKADFKNTRHDEDAEDIVTVDPLYEINAIRHKVTAPMKTFLSKVSGKRKASDICVALYDYLHDMDVPGNVEKRVAEFSKRGELDLADEYSQIWNMVIDLLDQVFASLGNEEMTFEEFADVIKIGFGEYETGLIPVSVDQVMVASAERSLNYSVKALIVLGVCDGVFPRTVLEEGILSDADRNIMAEGGIELAGDSKAKAFDEQFLVYKTLGAPSEYLRISWPSADHEGRAMRPSMIVSRMRRLFPAISEYSEISGRIAGDTHDTEAGEYNRITARAPVFREMTRMLREYADAAADAVADMAVNTATGNVNAISEEACINLFPDVWQASYIWFMNDAGWKQKCARINDYLLYRNEALPVSADKIEKLYGKPLIASVSRLEKYNACPYSFFIQYGIRAREREMYLMDPPDIGAFMHSAIEKFSRMAQSREISWRDLDRGTGAIEVSRVIDEMINEMEGSGIASSKRYIALARRLGRTVSRVVWLISEQVKRGSFEPEFYEAGFGGSDGMFPPIIIDLDSGGKAILSGRIDRIDLYRAEDGTYVRIIDYKSGVKIFKISDLVHGLQIQLAAYLGAISGGYTGMKPGGMLYFHVDDPVIKETGSASDEFIEKEIMKKLKLKGLILEDGKIIEAMDASMDGASLIIPARNGKDGARALSSGASAEQFKLMWQYTGKLMKEVCGKIENGRVPIRPYRKSGSRATPCIYCPYSAICRFDPSLEESCYRILPEYSNEEAWKLMEEKMKENSILN